MTLEELNAHRNLLTQKRKLEQILASLRNAPGLQASAMTGMPHGNGVTDKTGDFAVEIAELSNELDDLERRIAESEQVILAFVQDIENYQLRMIIRLRFLQRKSWREVAVLIGGGNTEQGIKNFCYRYLKS